MTRAHKNSMMRIIVCLLLVSSLIPLLIEISSLSVICTIWFSLFTLMIYSAYFGGRIERFNRLKEYKPIKKEIAFSTFELYKSLAF